MMIRAPHGQKLDAFQWTGDLAAFGHWFGEFMPVDAYERISIPADAARTKWHAVWHGSWIVRREGRCFVFSDDAYRLFVNPPHSTGTSPPCPLCNDTGWVGDSNDLKGPCGMCLKFAEQGHRTSKP
jgi:hypothetical protein